MESKVSESNIFLIETRRCHEGGDGRREELKNNNFVGKKKETHKIVGLRTIRLWINSKLFYTVRYNPFRGFQKPGRLSHVSSGVFEGINHSLPFKILDCCIEGKGLLGVFLLFKGEGEMVAVDHHTTLPLRWEPPLKQRVVQTH
jgi:hypothetical protein